MWRGRITLTLSPTNYCGILEGIITYVKFMEQKKVEIYTSPTCHYCKDLKGFLDEKSITYEEYDVTADEERRKELTERSQQMGVPVMFVDTDTMIVGFDREKVMEALAISE